MLLCGLICYSTALFAYKNSKYLLIFSLIYVFLIPFLIVKRANFKYVFVLLLSLLMIFSSLFTVKAIDSYKGFNNVDTSASFTVYETNNMNGKYKSLYAQIKQCNNIKADTKILLTCRENLEIGKTYSADLKVSSFESEFQEKSYYSSEIYLSAYANNIKVLENQTEIPLYFVGKLRNYIKNSLFENLGFSEASTMCALIFGKKDYFSDSFYRNVKLSGVSHVMVVSGMHLAIIITFILNIVNKFIYNKNLKAIIMFLTVLFLSALCGFTPSITRAGITYILLGISILLKRPHCAENSLGTAVTITLLLSPFTALNISFQLSILSTFGILSVALPVNEYLKDNYKFPKIVSYILENLLISLSAQILTLPVIIQTYGWISKYSIISNLLISFAVTIDLYITITALAIKPLLSFISEEILFKLSNLVTKYINYIINSIEKVPFPTIDIPKEFIAITIILILAIFYAMLACKKRRNMLKLKEMRFKIQQEGGKKIKWRL